MLHLLVELPNAAGFGRRTLVSANVPEESSGRVTGGRTGHEGADYLAVERPVTQRLANGTVRDDHERLMLVGVDTSRMSVDERERIRTSLRERWPDIQRFIDTLDWAHQDRNHAVEVASLSELLREPAFSSLPVTEATTPELAATDSGAARRWPYVRRFLPLGLASCAIGAIVLMVWPRPSPLPPTPSARETATLTADVCREMGCTDEELRRWVDAARNNPTATRGSEIDDATIRRLARTVGSRRLFALDPTPSESSQLNEFVESLSPTTAEQGETIRRTLLEAYGHLRALRDSATEARRCEQWRENVTAEGELSPAEIQFVAVLVDFGRSSLAACGEDNSLGPFFGPDDHCRFRELVTFFTDDARRHSLKTTAGIDCQSDRQSEAFREAIATMPRSEKELRRLVTISKIAYADTDCRAFTLVGSNFSKLCNTLARLRPVRGDP
jgi:hypothetical protein